MKSFSREQVIAAVLGFTSHYMVCVCISLPAPFLPMESELHGQNEAVTGLMLGFMPLVQTVFNPLWGLLTVNIGIKRLLSFGMLVSGFMTAAFGYIHYIPHDQTTMYTVAGFGIRTIQAAGTAAIFTTVSTLITELFPEHSTLMLSITGSLGGVGVMSGPAIGGGLFAVGGFWVVFVSVGGFMILISIFMFIFLPEPTQSTQLGGEHQQSLKLPYRKILLNPRMLISLLIGYFSAVKWAAIDPILEPELRHQYGMAETQSAMVFLLLSGAYVIATPIAGKTVGQPYCMDSLLVMVIGLVISTCAFLFAGPSPLLSIISSSKELYVLLICLSVMGITNCLLYVPAQDIVFNISRLDLPSDTNKTAVRGLLAGIWNSAYSLGTFTGMALSGLLEQCFGWAWTMTVYAMGCIFFLVIIIIIKLQESTRKCCPTSRALPLPTSKFHKNKCDSDEERTQLINNSKTEHVKSIMSVQ